MLLAQKNLGVHKTIHVLRLLGEAKQQLSAKVVETPHDFMDKIGLKH